MAVNSPKYRDYFITINMDAECYDYALDILNELNIKLYGYIVHDKDVRMVQDQNGELQEQPKATHKHIMLELKNPISFDSICKKFKGAHIEVPKYKKSAYQYLIHNSPRSHEKYQYAFTDIISNSPQELKYIIETETFELFKENMFLEYIADGTITPYQFTKRFGLNAYKQYWKPYSDMLALAKTDEEMVNDLRTIEIERYSNDPNNDTDLPF